ncbi:hypothetical protein [Sinosporangium siamense]|uniref:Uncharacterized protein n=1 Tax=Sinosporangium siamense TaxID=1367973 RepID=A0A919RDZ7_9ACTN|nr:hypothetical protein [Sinosporangium siamense]GII92140.1 hypothetical protein Ssi02_23710 [Sinosporangium siamense]
MPLTPRRWRTILTGTAVAASAQAGLRSLLTTRKVNFTPLWAVNAARVTGDAALAADIAKLPEFERVIPDAVLERQAPATTVQKAKTQAKVNGVEWNIDRIGANRVWSDFDARGEGVVAGNIGSPVDFHHPALAAQYRGRKADGSLDHNHNRRDLNWCYLPGNTGPCDYNGISIAGTMQMGVAVGGTETDRIGVAPARNGSTRAPARRTGAI